MGCKKQSTFGSENISDIVLAALKKDIIKRYGINPNEYDWTSLTVRVNKINAEQRYRVRDIIANLEKCEIEFGGSIMLSASAFAVAAGLNVKTVRSWIDKKILPYSEHRYAKYRMINICTRDAINKLKKM